MATSAAADITKGFVEVDGRDVHYVRRGRGPAVVMLHAAPCSSKVMAPHQEAWANDFTTFAFDLPGFGLSDMLDVRPLETAHLADAIAGAMNALGITQAALYGRHTGAGVAVELARRHPALCSMVLTDGYPIFPNPYSEERLKDYLTPIVPRWDGTHLVWAWFRYREQHMFWPWDKSQIAHRADTDVPGLPFLYRGTIELLESGANYPTVYASAFRHPGLAVIDEVKVPVCYGNRPGDSQFKTVKLYPQTSWVHTFSRSVEQATDEEREVLKRYPAKGDVPQWMSRFAPGAPNRPSLKDYVATRRGPTYVRGDGLTRSEMPILLLHDLPGGIDLEAGLMRELGDHAPIIGFDMFGNGNSTLAASTPLSVEIWVEQACDVLDALGLKQVLVYAAGTSALVAIELARARPDAVRGVVFRSPPVIDSVALCDQSEDYAPNISPARDGGNFLRLWHHLRDQELWYPWHTPTTACAKSTRPRIDPDELHRRAVILLKQPEQYREIWRTVINYPLADELSHMRVPSRVVSHEQDIFAFAADRAAHISAGTIPSKVKADASLAAVLNSAFVMLQ